MNVCSVFRGDWGQTESGMGSGMGSGRELGCDTILSRATYGMVLEYGMHLALVLVFRNWGHWSDSRQGFQSLLPYACFIAICLLYCHMLALLPYAWYLLLDSLAQVKEMRDIVVIGSVWVLGEAHQVTGDEICEYEGRRYTCSADAYCCGDTCCLSMHKIWWLWVVVGMAFLTGILAFLCLKRKSCCKSTRRTNNSTPLSVRTASSVNHRREGGEDPKPDDLLKPRYVYDSYGNIVLTQAYADGEGPPPYAIASQDAPYPQAVYMDFPSSPPSVAVAYPFEEVQGSSRNGGRR